METLPKPTPTVKQLRESGYKVRVIHSRRFLYIRDGKVNSINLSRKEFDDLKLSDDKKESIMEGLQGRGGETRVEILTPEGKEIWGGASCSIRDSYNKRTGVSLALKRALEAESLPTLN